MKDQHNISFDEQIKSAFEGAKLDPPSGVWESVSAQVGQQVVAGAVKTGIFKTVLSKIVAVAVIGTAATGGYLAINNLQKGNQDVNSANPVILNEVQKNNEGLASSETSQEITEVQVPAENLPNTTTAAGNTNNTETVENDKLNTDGKESSKSTPSAISNKSGQPGVTISVQNNPSLVLYQPDSVFCPGEIITYTLRSQTDFEKLIWEHPGAILISSERNSVKLKYTKEGVYDVKVKGKLGSTEVLISRKVFVKNPVIHLMSKTEGSQVLLSAGGDRFNRFVWTIQGESVESTGTSSLKINTADYPNIEQLHVQVKGIKNEYCEALTQTDVKLPKLAKDPFVPNVFTPTQQDGKNDCFSVEIEAPEMYYMLIKNRNGAVVFESSNPAECWNGKVMNKGAECPPDAYFYQLIYKLPGSDKVAKNGRLQLF